MHRLHILVVAILVAASVVTSSSTHAQAWRPRTTQVNRGGTTVTTRTTTRNPSIRPRYRSPGSRGIANARAHGGKAHAYGHRRYRRAVVRNVR